MLQVKGLSAKTTIQVALMKAPFLSRICVGKLERKYGGAERGLKIGCINALQVNGFWVKCGKSVAYIIKPLRS